MKETVEVNAETLQSFQDDLQKAVGHAIYEAARPIEDAEHAGLILGNAHHIRQLIVSLAITTLRHRWLPLAEITNKRIAPFTLPAASGGPRTNYDDAFIARVEAAHFRTEHDTGANEMVMMIWNMVREHFGLKKLTRDDLPVWCTAHKKYHKLAADYGCASGRRTFDDAVREAVAKAPPITLAKAGETADSMNEAAGLKETGTTRWTLEEGLAFIRTYQGLATKLGFNLSLGGDVLNNGCSDHDLDIVVCPARNTPKSFNPTSGRQIVDTIAEEAGLCTVKVIQWNNKMMLVVTKDEQGRQIDFFVVGYYSA